MEVATTTSGDFGDDPPLVDETQPVEVPIRLQIEQVISKSRSNEPIINDDSSSKDESGIVIECMEDIKDSKNVGTDTKEPFADNEAGEMNEDARSMGDLDSLPAGDELALGAAGSDSGVEGCGRALSSGGGSRSCASSVVSCGSGCGSESSSVAGAPPRPRRRVNVALPDNKRHSPVGASTPRPVTAPRGPNLATRERARSREKPTPPEKPRPLTPKPRIRPTTDLPNLVRESPALRAKPTKTSAARCRTPNSPSEEKRWPAIGPRLAPVADASATRVAADKYGTLPRRRRDPDVDGSPKHESAPPPPRRPTITRSASTRTTKTRVRIYAEKVSQTVLVGADIEAALAGVVPNIENRVEVHKCHRGVQASSRDAEMARLAAAAAAARAEAAAEQDRRALAEAQLADERVARTAAIQQLENNSKKLLELAGAAGAGAGAEGCLRALEEQLRAASELAAKQRAEIDALRKHADDMQREACASRALAARLAEAEREAQEMQDFLAAETAALGDSLHDADATIQRLNADLERRRAECRQLVRMCEQRRQEALAAMARARCGGGAGGAGGALAALARRLRALTAQVLRAHRLPPDAALPTVFYNDAFSRSDSGEALSPEEEGRGLLAAVARALKAAGPAHSPAGPAPAAPAPSAPALAPVTAPAPCADDDRSRLSDDNDNSADLLDSETEPCLVTDPEYAEEWWSGAEGGGGWSADELSPERDSAADAVDRDCESVSERDSLRNLSAAIAQRQRSEAEDMERGSLLERVLAVDNRLTELLRALRLSATADDDDAQRLANALRDRLDVTEKNVADVVVKKLAELDASKNMMDQYRHSVETLKKQMSQTGEDDDLQRIEEELSWCSEADRQSLYTAVDCALAALAGCLRARTTPRLAALAHTLERLAFALATPPPAPTPPPHTAQPAHIHTTA